jgi:hypothetical protein
MIGPIVDEAAVIAAENAFMYSVNSKKAHFFLKMNAIFLKKLFK